MDEDIAAGFFRHGTETLLVRRDGSERPSTRWGPVSVPFDNDATAVPNRLISSIGLEGAAAHVRSADPIVVEDDGTSRTIRPYLFECDDREVALDDPIAAHEWVQPPTMLDRKTVPGSWDAYFAVAPSIRTVRGDTDHGAAFVSLRALEVLRDRAAVVASVDENYGAIASAARKLRRARPSMGVIEVRIDRVMATADRTPASVRDLAIAACSDAVAADLAAAERAVSLLGDRVLTLSRSETVRTALESADPDVVYVAESRPAREGIGVAERLAETGIDVTVLIDAAIEGLVASGTVDTVVVGADAVLADGSVVNKVGARTAIRAGNEANIDGYAVCSRDKIVLRRDFDTESGPSEAVYEGDADLGVHNPTFERVPATVLSGIITEDGVHSPDGVESIARSHASYCEWVE